MAEHAHYYVPATSHWPIVGSLGLISTALGVVNMLHGNDIGHWLFLLGAFILAFMMFGWFGDVIRENYKDLYSKQMDRSFRMGMMWFIFSEVMFFAAFFGALYYARHFVVPWLGGIGAKSSTHLVLWPEFKAMWPLLKTPNPDNFVQPRGVMDAWGLPALNTLILLTSGLTLTWAHWGIQKKNRNQIMIGLALTVLLGFTFLCFQAFEYHHAYSELDLKLSSGIYGSTFFMLTGFHGAHVTVGAIMLTVMLVRSIKGHFSPENHFAFEAAAWYWHFVDVVWLLLFVLVYWL